VIEKEYAARLNALAKRYFEKKAKKSSGLSVGETPSMTPGSLERYPGSPVMDICPLCPSVAAPLTIFLILVPR